MNFVSFTFWDSLFADKKFLTFHNSKFNKLFMSWSFSNVTKQCGIISVHDHIEQICA